MSLLQTIFSSGGLWVEDPEDPRWWTPGWGDLGGKKTDSGAKVTAKTALGLSTYFACLRNISEDIGKLPLKVYRKDGRTKAEATDHPVYRLLHDEPNREMSAMAWRETVTHHAMGWGMGVSEIERDGAGRIIAFWPIHPSRIKLVRDEQRRLLYEIRTQDAGVETTYLPPEDVLHIHGLGGKGTTGYPLSVLAAQTIGLGLQTEKFAARFFGNGIVLSGYLKHPGKLGKEAKEHIKRMWRTEYGGAEKSHDIAVLAEDMEWQQMGIPPEQAQFLQSRQFSVEDIARWFRMPPHKVQQLLRSTFKNIESQAIEYVVDTLLPWAKRWEQELKRKCFRDETDLIAKHEFKGLLRGDDQKRAAFYRTMWFVGAMSQDDIRECEDMNPIEGGHGGTYYVPSNVTPSEIAAKGQVNSAKGQQRRPAPDNMPAAHLPLFEDALNRVLTKEVRATRRAAERFENNAEGLADWVAEFYQGHRQYVIDALRPAARVFTKLQGNGVDIEEILCDFAAAHCAASTMQLNDDDKSTGKWLTDRPRDEALALMSILGEENHGTSDDHKRIAIAVRA